MRQEIKDKLLEFLQFCKTNKIEIGACGCCQSPWIDIEDVYITDAAISQNTKFEEFIKNAKESK